MVRSSPIHHSHDRSSQPPTHLPTRSKQMNKPLPHWLMIALIAAAILAYTITNTT